MINEHKWTSAAQQQIVFVGWQNRILIRAKWFC